MTMRDLQTAALKLPVSRRARLAATLLSSLDSDEPAEIEDAWMKEADRRYRAYKSGKLQAIPAADAIRKARESLR
jgi:putative addiction module component (TIGR02574 family)